MLRGWEDIFRNDEMMLDRFLLTGFFNYNMGKISEYAESTKKFDKTVSIGGLSANLRAGYRYGQTTGDAITAEALVTTGDANGISDGKYSGVVTANTWGSPAAIFVGSGAYILFPHGNVVNRFVAAVTDISNGGYGLVGGTFNVAKDIIPNKFHSKIGFASAISAYRTCQWRQIYGMGSEWQVGI